MMKLTNKILLGTFILILIAIFILLLIIKNQIKNEFSINGKDNNTRLVITNKELHSANFRNIKILTPSSVKVIKSKNYNLDISASEHELSNLKINIFEDNLIISSKINNAETKERLSITISTPHIEKIEASSPSCISIEKFTLDSLEISIHYAGKITGIDSYIKNLKIDSSVIGNIDFKNCRIVNAILNLNGKNRIEINMAGGILKGNINGTSFIKYYGNVKENKLVASGSVYMIDKSNRENT